MKRLLLATIASFAATFLAHADEPTVTLTASELQAIVSAELARANAAAAMRKVQSAFAPKSEPAPGAVTRDRTPPGAKPN